ncbi:MAG: hypothetical protein REI78_13475 [Pedobacter sp.]|nr:hypothetical protein [Pedobacter sp.]MDQ8054039.1 hypothetical protein [Pedobacter sp.]
MKNLKPLYLIIFLALFKMGCSKYTFTPLTEAKFNQGRSDQDFVIDKSFQLFLKKTFKDSEKNNKKISRDAAGTVIEKNFLLISFEKKQAIYLTYIPDKYRNMYSSDIILDDNLVNFVYFRTMQFGTLSDDLQQITFLQTKKPGHTTSDTWEFTRTGKQLKLNAIIERKNGVYAHTYNLDEAFGKKVIFEEMPNYLLVHRMIAKTEVAPKPGKNANIDISEDPQVLVNNEIVLTNSVDPGKFYLKFADPSFTKVTYLSFPIERILYDHKQFFK